MIPHPDAVMIFAAGFGTRLGDLTKDIPKPMVAVAGRPLIDHTLDLVRDIHPRRIVMNTHYKAEILSRHLASSEVVINHEAETILDTGGGLRNALPLLGAQTVYTVNCDVIWNGPNPLKLLSDHWNPNVMDGLLLCVPMPRAVGRKGAGDFSIDHNGHLSRKGDLVYTGVQIIKAQGLYDIPDTVFSLNVLWDKIAQQNRLKAVEYPGHWCDVGHPEGIGLAEQLIAKTYV